MPSVSDAPTYQNGLSGPITKKVLSTGQHTDRKPTVSQTGIQAIKQAVV